MWIAPASGARISIIAINLLALGFIVLAVGQTIASWSADLVEGRRRVRVFIVSAAALYGGMNAMSQIRDLRQRRGGRRQCRQFSGAGRHRCRDHLCDDARRWRRTVSAAPAANVASEAVAAQEQSAADQKLVAALMRLMARRAHLPPRQCHHRHAGDQTCHPRIPAAAADQPAARLPQFQCLPQRAPDRRSQGGAGRSEPGRGPRHYDRDGRRLPVARALQPRLQGDHRRHADRISPAEGQRGIIFIALVLLVYFGIGEAR